MFLIGSSIESINIPQNVSYIDSECFWCAFKLVNVIVSPLNKNFIYFNNQFLLGKSDPFINFYDTIKFCRRDIVKGVIPSYIKIISSCAFSTCYHLKTIEFQNNSTLTLIESTAFSMSKLEKIMIPLHVTIIEDDAFAYSSVNYVELNEESKLCKIGNCAFLSSSINSIYVPKNVSKIGKYAFRDCKKLEIIEISEHSRIKVIDQAIFMNSSIKIIMISSNLRIII